MKAKYRFGDYGSYKDMLKYMRTIEFYYPHVTKLVRIGISHEGVPIEGLKVSKFFHKFKNKEKKTTKN